MNSESLHLLPGPALCLAVGLLAAYAASAAVVTIPVPLSEGLVAQTGGPEELRSIDLNQDGIEDFQFRAVMRGQFAIFPSGMNRVSASPPPPPDHGAYLDSMTPGNLVGAGAAFSINWWRDEEEIAFGATVPDAWIYLISPDKSGPGPNEFYYAGLEFAAADGVHYGYIRLYRNRFATFYTDLAWETEPAVPIQIPVPEPGVTLFVVPAALVTLRRRRAGLL